MISIVAIVFHYLELINLQLEHEVLYQLLQMLSSQMHFVAPDAEEKTQSADQVSMRLISEVIQSISRVLQKLLTYFNGTPISSFFCYHHQVHLLFLP